MNGITRWGTRAGVALAVWLSAAAPSFAHWADLAVAEIDTRGTEARMTLTIPTGLVAVADDDKNGKLSTAEVARHAPALQARLGSAIALTSDGRPGALAIAAADADVPVAGTEEGPHTSLALTYRFTQPIGTLALSYGLFEPGISTARCLATIAHNGQVHSVVLTPERPTFSTATRNAWQEAGSFVGIGVEHIIFGFDHVLFLIGLLLLGGGWWHLLKMVTAFTVAHSVTLSLGVLGLVSIPTQWVESAIALTIIYVAVENLWRRGSPPPRRWTLAFAFGLIHGLGFASAMSELELPTANLVGALAGFNLGVELGQVGIVVAATLALNAIRKATWAPAFRAVASGSVAACGLFWFIERAF